jgi:hypothetical protein
MTRHILQYNTHAEKRFFLGQRQRELYDLVALNGNIVSWSPSGTAAFLATAAKAYYIDPQTHAFQHATRHLKRDVSSKAESELPRYEFKPSIAKLARERLGEPFSQVLDEDSPLRPSVFLDDVGELNSEAIESMCRAVGSFQRNLMRSELDEETLEYIDDEGSLTPEFLIAPYFYLGPPHPREWLRVNLASYAAMRELFDADLVFMALAIPKSVLAMVDWGWLVLALEELRPRGILLWIDDHDEREIDEYEVARYLLFLRTLKGTTDELLVPHGGYLSTLAAHREMGPLLDGVGHSSNYGEHRAVVPIGGGIPMARFYMPSLHARLRHGDAAGLIQQKGWLETQESYEENVCSCAQCRDLIRSEGSVDAAFAFYGASVPVTFTRRNRSVVRLYYPTTEAREAAGKHYLLNKAAEVRGIEERGLHDLLQELEDTWHELEDIAGYETAGHLIAWTEGIRAFLAD